jgi:hypothetical protein
MATQKLEEEQHVLQRHLGAIQLHVDLLAGALRQERQRRKDVQSFTRVLKEELETLVRQWQAHPERASRQTEELETVLRRRFM